MLGNKTRQLLPFIPSSKNRQSEAVNVNRVLHVIVEHVRVGKDRVLGL